MALPSETRSLLLMPHLSVSLNPLSPAHSCTPVSFLLAALPRSAEGSTWSATVTAGLVQLESLGICFLRISLDDPASVTSLSGSLQVRMKPCAHLCPSSSKLGQSPGLRQKIAEDLPCPRHWGGVLVNRILTGPAENSEGAWGFSHICAAQTGQVTQLTSS